MSKSMLDWITECIEFENKEGITYDQFCEAMRSGDPIAIQDAVERMEAAGGYDNLE